MPTVAGTIIVNTLRKEKETTVFNWAKSSSAASPEKVGKAAWARAIPNKARGS